MHNVWTDEAGVRLAQERSTRFGAGGVRARLSTPTTGLVDDDVRWLPETYIRLGELYEARNDTTKAVHYYNEFVELWKDADQELQPQVDDIRRRIGTLTREPGAGN